jgi:putative Holliday junction resolvase
MGRIVAVDYGRKRIGIAMTDDKKLLALPYKKIFSGKSIKDSAKNILEALREKFSEIEEMVIGLPLLLSGAKGEMVEEVEKLKKELLKEVNFKIVLWDERLTSSQAHVIFKDVGISRKKRTEKVDLASATIILQSYLDSSFPST